MILKDAKPLAHLYLQFTCLFFFLLSSSTALLQSCLFQTTHLRNHTQGYFVLEPVRPGPDRKKLTLLLVIETRSVS